MSLKHDLIHIELIYSAAKIVFARSNESNAVKESKVSDIRKTGNYVDCWKLICLYLYSTDIRFRNYRLTIFSFS